MLLKLSDQPLHLRLKNLVQQERHLLTQVLEHLHEVERRRLYSDFNCSSLFDYAVNELGYSEDQACRRIQAMRLMKAVPEVKEKLSSGALSLTNAAKAQGLFRKTSQSSEVKSMSRANKLSILTAIEYKSTRDAERELTRFQPNDILPMDRQKAVSATHTELKIVVDQRTMTKLEEVRALLGPKGTELSHGELLQIMAEAAIEKLSAKRFGKRRVQQEQLRKSSQSLPRTKSAATPRTERATSKNQRYLSAAMKQAVWQRDRGQCSKCGSKRNLQYDHLRPVGMGGDTTIDNLRLLCFHCNQRAAMRVYGVDAVLVAVANAGRRAKE